MPVACCRFAARRLRESPPRAPRGVVNRLHVAGVRKRCHEPRRDHRERPAHAETPRAHISRCAGLGGKSSLAVAHNGEKPSTRGVYRGARKVKGGGIAYTRTCFSLLPTSGTSRARCATRAASAEIARRLAEFCTERAGLSQKFRSFRRLCATRGDLLNRSAESL